MASKWWKITDKDLLDFLRAKEVVADLSNFYIGEMVDVIVDGKHIKRRCFDTPSGNTINVKGYRVCYDDFNEPADNVVESKLNINKGDNVMKLDWNTIKNNKVIKNDYHDKEIYRQAFGALLEDYPPTDNIPGGYRILVDGNYETEFSANSQEEAIQKFKNYFAGKRGVNNSRKPVKSAMYGPADPEPADLQIDMTNTGYFEDGWLLLNVVGDGPYNINGHPDGTEFTINAYGPNGEDLGSKKFDFLDLWNRGSITSGCHGKDKKDKKKKKAIKSSFTDYKNMLYGMVEDGELDAKQTALNLIQWLSVNDCEDYLRKYEIIGYEE